VNVADLRSSASVGDLEGLKRVAVLGNMSPTALGEALEAAAGAGHLPIVRYLVEDHGVDIAAGDHAALMAAAANGHLETVAFLHQHGADVQARDGVALCLAAAKSYGDVVRYLHANGAEHCLLSAEGRARIRAMQEEIQSAPEIYHPSRIWEFFADINGKMLSWGGETNFKRTVNQNYFNFIPTSLRDPKILNLGRLWLRHRSLKPFGCRIEDPDRDPSRWCSWDERYFVFKENHDFRLRLYKWLVGSLYEYALKMDPAGALARLEEPELGNPIRVWRDGKLISQDLVNSVRERNAIVAALPGAEADPTRRVAELGAGYGRLGYVLLASTNWRYFVFDIPPALYISEWYLSRLFPERRVFRFRPFASYAEIAAELEDAQIAFFTANQVAAFPEGYFDVFATISSLHEMRPGQIAHFLRLMASRTREAVYLKQHEDYVNPWDNLRIRRTEYGLPPGWRIAREGPDTVNPGFFELLARREAGAG